MQSILGDFAGPGAAAGQLGARPGSAVERSTPRQSCPGETLPSLGTGSSSLRCWHHQHHSCFSSHAWHRRRQHFTPIAIASPLLQSPLASPIPQAPAAHSFSVQTELSAGLWSLSAVGDELHPLYLKEFASQGSTLGTLHPRA